MYHTSSGSYNEPVPIVVQQYDVGSAFHALVGILALCRRKQSTTAAAAIRTPHQQPENNNTV